MDILFYVLIGLIVLIILWVIAAFNRFVRLINRAKEAWADIDVQLKRRYDLIPNLINTVKGYASHEAKVLADVTEARTRSMNAEVKGDVKGVAEGENMLAGALKNLFAVSENYPDLKANENFLELQRELSDTENKIQAARRFYNTNVMNLNTAVESFPSNIIANMFKFTQRDFFELGEGESAAKEPVQVKF